MKFTLTPIDPNTCSIEELESEISRLKNVTEEYNGIQNSIKVFINSVYGATGSPYFGCYNVNIAEAVTLQGQDLAKYASRCIDEYFTEVWHTDKKLHKELGLDYVNKINEKTTLIYTDTDSIFSDAIIITNNGILRIEDWYNQNKESAGKTIINHESVKTQDKILNWSLTKDLYFVPVKRIIRHKVSKPKWKLKTKSGKEITVTNDHSLVVFRDNHQIEIKPKDVCKGDKVICIKHEEKHS
jgi:hypothetical protein